jgi:hypothetical protein
MTIVARFRKERIRDDLLLLVRWSSAIFERCRGLHSPHFATYAAIYTEGCSQLAANTPARYRTEFSGAPQMGAYPTWRRLVRGGGLTFQG